MLTTVASVLAAVALLLPGFIIAELAKSGRARAVESDLSLALRALVYALILHAASSWWTSDLVRRIEDDGWTEHVVALTLYALVVLLCIPAALGVAINAYVGRAELRDGKLSRLALALGGHDARDAFDYAFQRLKASGAWVIVELVGHSPNEPRLLGGRYGQASAVGQTPGPHDVFLEELWLVTENEQGLRNFTGEIRPARGVYLAANQIARIELVRPPLREVR